MAPRRSALQIRKLADKSGSRRDDGSWPALGLVAFEGEAPKSTIVPTTFIERGLAEGWLEAEGGTPVVRPAGPTQDVWTSSHTGTPHVFVHYDALTFKTPDGPIRYKVDHQPDKYVDGGSDTQKVTKEIYAEGRTRVDHFYGLTRAD